MSIERTFQQTIRLAIVVVLFVGCGGTQAEPTATSTPVPPTPTPTQPPTATSTPVPPTARPTQPATATIAVTQVPKNVVAEIDAFLTRSVEMDTFCGSVLIAQDGEILLSKGYGLADRENELPNTPHTRFRIGSITKQFTAMAILMLQAQGKLDVQDPICDYLPDCPEEWRPVTIHYLLTHTSGLPDIPLPVVQQRKATPTPPEQVITLLKDYPMSFQPGKEWSYNNPGYIILGYIIEQVSGQTYEAYLQQSIFDPLGMQDSGYDHNRDDLAIGYANRFRKADYVDMTTPFSAGALYSTVEDLYRWDQALYTERLVPSEYLAQMFTEQAYIENGGGSEGEASYGYGWFILDHLGHKQIAHGGGIEGYLTFISRYPDDRLTIIVLSNQQDTKVGLFAEILAKKVLAIE